MGVKPSRARYKQVKVSVYPEIAAAFKERCMAAGVSMAGEIARFMSGHNASGNTGNLSRSALDTRKKRRKAVKTLIPMIEAVMDAEQRYIDNVPENLSGSCFYEAAEQTAAALEEALGSLREAYQ